MTDDRTVRDRRRRAGRRARPPRRCASEGFDGRIVADRRRGRAALRAAAAVQGLPARRGRARRRVRAPAEAWYAEHDVDLRRGTDGRRARPRGARGRARRRRALRLRRLLLATGSEPGACRSPAPSSTASTTCARIADSDRLRAMLDAGHAAGRRRRRLDRPGGRRGGARSRAPRSPWSRARAAAAARARPARSAPVFADLHRDHGVDLRARRRRSRRSSATAGVARVRLADGAAVDATSSSSASASRPRTELAEAAGLTSTTASSSTSTCAPAIPDIFAAGDVANADHPVLGAHVRVEHWANALNQGRGRGAQRCSARTRAYDRLPVLLLRPVRPRHGVRRLRGPGRLRRGRLPRRRRRARVHRLLARRRAGAGRHERQRLGRQRRHPGAGPRGSRSTTTRCATRAWRSAAWLWPSALRSAAGSPRRSARARPRPRSPRGARPSRCPGSAASRGCARAARPARPGRRGVVRLGDLGDGPPGSASSPAASGNHGMKPMPWSSQ